MNKFVLVAALLTGCVHGKMSPIVSQLLQCEGEALADASQKLVPQVMEALQNQNQWAGALDDLIAAEGPAAVCALPIVAGILEKKIQGVKVASTNNALLVERDFDFVAMTHGEATVALIHLHSYHQAHWYRAKWIKQ